MLQSLNNNSFKSTIQNNEVVLVDFYADWCGPCQVIKPTLEELDKEFEGKAVIAKVDVDKEGALAANFGIRSIPSLLFFKNGELTQVYNGVQSKQRLATTIDNLLDTKVEVEK